jgi:hypothetical protein
MMKLLYVKRFNTFHLFTALIVGAAIKHAFDNFTAEQLFTYLFLFGLGTILRNDGKIC